MSEERPEAPLLLFDACCLINLFATGRIEEILACLPFRCATSRLVASREVLAIAVEGLAAEPLGRDVIPASRLETVANLALLDLDTDEELAAFVGFALELDDGEASVCSLAVARGRTVATDDRKALRIMAELTPPVLTVQTPDLLFEWAERLEPPKAEIRSALQRVQRRGRFYPRVGAPRLEWWETFLQG
ncbi:MAG TPA: hypothetical protein VOA80_22205 [Thermoanaerobaculia bacterium]|nr:hypothetical protein [Thermoanaerobaculia bacterium]